MFLVGLSWLVKFSIFSISLFSCTQEPNFLVMVLRKDKCITPQVLSIPWCLDSAE